MSTKQIKYELKKLFIRAYEQLFYFLRPLLRKDIGKGSDFQ